MFTGKPPWSGLEGAERMAALLGNKFCHPCPVHHDLVNNSCSYFCLDYQGLAQKALCFYCRVNHPPHRVLQASLSEVVQAEDLHGLVDISGVQLDSINRRKVVFLNQRPNARCPLRGIRIYVRKFACMVCSRGLMEGAKFCSLECKVQAEPRYVQVQDESQGPSSMPSDKETNGMRYRSLYDMYLVCRKGRKAGTHPWCPNTGKEGGPCEHLLKPLKGVVQSPSLEKPQPASGKSRRKGRPVRAPFY